MPDCKRPTMPHPAKEAQGQKDTATLPGGGSGRTGVGGSQLSSPLSCQKEQAPTGVRTGKPGRPWGLRASGGEPLCCLPAAGSCSQPFFLPDPGPTCQGQKGRVARIEQDSGPAVTTATPSPSNGSLPGAAVS